MVKKALIRMKGFLTNDDIRLLEEASQRVPKYPKKQSKKWKCSKCDFVCSYKTIKCPICSSLGMEEIKN